GSKEGQRLPEMVGCFHISGTLKRPLRSSLPVADGRIGEPCSSIVQGQQLRFGLRSFRKFLFQRLGNALVEHLAAALEQVLIGHFLHQRVLEAVEPRDSERRGCDDMVRYWHELGFVLPRKTAWWEADSSEREIVQVETERRPHAGMDVREL